MIFVKFYEEKGANFSEKGNLFFQPTSWKGKDLQKSA